ncbi:MAG: NnrU family protein [Hyphomicrobiales bacterium]
MIAFFGGLIIFLGIHSVRIFAPQTRERFVGSYGEGPWKGVYTLVSILSFIAIIYGYQAAKAGLGFVWAPPVWTRHLAVLLMLPALIFLVAAYVPSKLKARLKHPMLLGVKVWALAHLLANGLGVHLALFGAFFVWAIMDRVSVKRRGAPHPVAPSGWTGDIIAVLAGTALWVFLLLWGHQWLFGVAPIG